MHITLIKPKIGHPEGQEYLDEGRMEPLMLGVLGGLTPPEHEVVLWDDRFEEVPFDAPTDLVAITIETFTARRSYEIAAEYRRRGVPVIMGGMHATLIPDEVQAHADSVLLGNAEGAWGQALDDLAAGRLQKRYQGGTNQVQNGTFPRRDLFAGKGYLPVSLIQFSRGCPHECFYCATSTFFCQEHHVRPWQEVLEEIAQRKLLFFVDDNFTANREAAKALLKELIPLKISWVGQLCLEAADDPELLSLMAKSGCLGFVVGFESLDPRNLDWMKKSGVNSRAAGLYSDQIKRFKDKGFQIWAAFTLGHDHDTVESLAATVDFALDHRFSFAAFNTLLPYPGTPLYARLKEEDRLLYDGRWWLHPDYRFNYAAFEPKNMSADELTLAGQMARKRFNSVPSVIHRALDIKTNLRSLPRLLYFLRYSLLFRREVKRKEGMVFGS